MRILLIEDEKGVASLLKKNLKAEYFEIDIAYDGEKGLFLSRINLYDLIILDLILPKKSGEEVCQEIRKEGKNLNTPILVVSAKVDVPSKVSLLNLGADDYIIKPFSFEELSARIKALLRRPQIRKGSVLKIGNVLIDKDKHTVEINKTNVFLTRKEFTLLELFSERVGEVISRGVIIDRVWNMDLDPFSNTVESHIASLRKKIKNETNKAMIKNIPGVGYKMEIQS